MFVWLAFLLNFSKRLSLSLSLSLSERTDLFETPNFFVDASSRKPRVDPNELILKTGQDSIELDAGKDFISILFLFSYTQPVLNEKFSLKERERDFN